MSIIDLQLSQHLAVPVTYSVTLPAKLRADGMVLQ